MKNNLNYRIASVVDGLPFIFKVVFKVEPYPFIGRATFTPSCCKIMPESPLVKKFQDTGAINTGITNMQEFGTGALGSKPHKEYLTPLVLIINTFHCPGGSSFGSACSVAASLCPTAMVVDGGGSICIPADLCGLTSLKLMANLLDNCGCVPNAFIVGSRSFRCINIDLALTRTLLVLMNQELIWK